MSQSSTVIPGTIFAQGDEIVVNARKYLSQPHALEGAVGEVVAAGVWSGQIQVRLKLGGSHTVNIEDIRHRDPQLAKVREEALLGRVQGLPPYICTCDMRVDRPGQLPPDPVLDPRIWEMVAASHLT